MSLPTAPTHRTRRPRRLRRRRACTAWGLATLTAFATLSGGTGCTTWNAGRLPRGGAPSAVTYDHPVRLRFANGNTAVLTHARVVGDSLVGEVDDETSANAGAAPRRFAVALGEVRGLEEQQVSGGRTAALLLVPLIALGVVVAVAASNIKVGPTTHCGGYGCLGLVRPGAQVRGPGQRGRVTVGAP